MIDIQLQTLALPGSSLSFFFDPSSWWVLHRHERWIPLLKCFISLNLPPRYSTFYRYLQGALFSPRKSLRKVPRYFRKLNWKDCWWKLTVLQQLVHRINHHRIKIIDYIILTCQLSFPFPTWYQPWPSSKACWWQVRLFLGKHWSLVRNCDP